MDSRFSNDPGLRRTIAGASPGDLLKQGGFWRRQRGFLLILGFSAMSFLVLAPYTYDYAKGWVFLTIAIQLLALSGAYISAKSLAVLEVETAIVTEIEVRGAEYLRDIKSGHIERIDLDRLEETMLPDNPSDPPPAMIRLFQHICKEAKDRKFESSVILAQPYHDEPLEDIFKLQNLQKIALWLGILGTFIGLLLAIQTGDLSKHQGDDMAFFNMIGNMFKELSIAFNASLAGLEVAVILGMFLLLLRKRQELYFKNMESAAVTMLSLARNSINKDDFLTEFHQINTTVSDLSDRIHRQTEEVSGTILGVQGKIKDQTGQIQKGIEQLADAKLQFDRFLMRMSDAQKQFIDDIKGTYDIISMKNLGPALQEGLIQAGRRIADPLNIGAAQISNQLVRFNESLTTLGGALASQAQRTAEIVNMLEDQIKASTMENANALKTMIERHQDSIDRNADMSRSLQVQLQYLSLKIERLSATVEQLEYFFPAGRWGFRKAINSIKQGFMNLISFRKKRRVKYEIEK
jgi:hypothetical protein